MGWIWYDMITLILFYEEYKLWNSSLCSSAQSLVTSLLLVPNILLSTLFSSTIKLCLSLNVGYQVSHPYKTRRLPEKNNAILLAVGFVLERSWFALYHRVNESDTPKRLKVALRLCVDTVIESSACRLCILRFRELSAVHSRPLIIELLLKWLDYFTIFGKE
jgi:hypothetical protein